MLYLLSCPIFSITKLWYGSRYQFTLIPLYLSKISLTFGTWLTDFISIFVNDFTELNLPVHKLILWNWRIYFYMFKPQIPCGRDAPSVISFMWCIKLNSHFLSLSETLIVLEIFCRRRCSFTSRVCEDCVWRRPSEPQWRHVFFTSQGWWTEEAFKNDK